MTPFPSDMALLQRWRDQRDAHAFRALTQRYGGLVFGICNRMLRNAADAEEVTQDCFLKLALRPEAAERAVGPWLHSVAVRGALDRIRMDKRRRVRDRTYGESRPQSMEPANADDLLEHVDAAIDALPEDLRRCVVGHFLEGVPQEELANALGVSTRTVRRKTHAGIEQVRTILAGRGVVTSVGGLAGVLAAMDTSALPPTLGVQLGKIAIGGKASVSTAGVWSAANWATYTGGVILMKKFWATVAMVFILGALIWWIEPSSTDGDLATSAPVAGIPAGAPATNGSDSAEPTEPGQVTGEEMRPTDDDTLALTSTAGQRTLEDIPPIPNPTKYGELAGVVKDTLDRPIAGATVTLLAAGVDADSVQSIQLAGYPAIEDATNTELKDKHRYSVVARALALPGHEFSATTDSEGRFLIRGIRYPKSGRVAAAAPGFTTEQKYVQLAEETRAEVSLTLQDALPIHGKVVTPKGRAVPGARVVALGTYTETSGAASSKSPLAEPFWAETDAQGHFSLWLADATWASLLVESETYGKGLFHRVFTGGDTVITLRLEAAMATLGGQLLLAEKAPAAGYFVHLSGSVSGATESSERPMPAADGSQFEVRTDAEGRFQIDPIPANETYTAKFYDPRGGKAGETVVPALERDEVNQWTYELRPPMRVAGRVVGKPSGSGLAEITVRGMHDFEPGDSIPGLESVTTENDGSFALDFFGEEGTFNILASRDGHAGFSHSGPWHAQVALRYGETETITIELADPWSRRFVLLEPDGIPVPGASVRLNQSAPSGGSIMGLKGAETDLDGRFECGNLSGEAEVQVTFQKDGYLSTAAESMPARPGEDVPEELVIMYPEASAITRLVDTQGLPVANARVLCSVAYGDGLTLVREMATDAEGWAIIEGGLPATEVAMAFRLPPPPDWVPERVMVSTGSISEQRQQSTLANEFREASRADTLQGSEMQLVLNRGEQNDLGEMVLAPGEDTE